MATSESQRHFCKWEKLELTTASATEEKKQQVLALGRLGWSLRRIQQETGTSTPAKAANEVITDSGEIDSVEPESGRWTPSSPSESELIPRTNRAPIYSFGFNQTVD